MNRKIQKALKDAFEAPPPLSKEAFLRTVPHPRISNPAFVFTQVAYIPLWVWGVSGIAFVIALMSARLMERHTLGMLSVCIPFVASTAAAENGKSAAYKMAELEMASRFSLKSVALARLGIIGTAHLLLICLISPLAGLGNLSAALRAGVYLLVPYLLTTWLCLICARRFHHREILYLCMGTAVMVSGFCVMAQLEFRILYQEDYFLWWVALLTILLAFTASEYAKTIQRTEELTWN